MAYDDTKDGWKDVPLAGTIPEPGNSAEYKTGSWRAFRPIWHEDKCIQCLNCWAYCPDCAVKLDEKGKVCGIDYDYCKGCGICAKECPEKAGAIEMVLETEAKKQQGGDR